MPYFGRPRLLPASWQRPMPLGFVRVVFYPACVYPVLDAVCGNACSLDTHSTLMHVKKTGGYEPSAITSAGPCLPATARETTAGVSIRLGIPRSKNQWILAMMGAAVTIGCAVPLAQGVRSLSWPKVDGFITHSRNMPGYRTMGVDIGYTYATGGKSYTGDRFRFQFVLSARKMIGRDVQSILGRYRVGEPVRIAFNPGNPADSVLEPGPDYNSMIPFALGLLLLPLGLGHVGKDYRRPGTSEYPMPTRPRYAVAKTLTAIALALFLFGGFYLYQGISSTQWPSVEGRILYSHARSGAHPETLLWYEYYVDNRRYLGSNYRNGGNTTPFRQVAETAANRYPAQRAVRAGSCDRSACKSHSWRGSQFRRRRMAWARAGRPRSRRW